MLEPMASVAGGLELCNMLCQRDETLRNEDMLIRRRRSLDGEIPRSNSNVEIVLKNNAGNLVTSDHGLQLVAPSVDRWRLFIQLTSRYLKVENPAYLVPWCLLLSDYAMLLMDPNHQMLSGPKQRDSSHSCRKPCRDVRSCGAEVLIRSGTTSGRSL